jgi:hypothetical protein
MSFNIVDVFHLSDPSTAFSPLHRERFARNSENIHASVMAEAAGKFEGAAKTKGSAQVQDTRKTKTTQQTVFHPFSRLPAELRARIWAIALEDQREQGTDHLRMIRGFHVNAVEVHEHEKMDGVGVREKQLRVVTTRGYPTLFSVSREARYEAAKVDGGAWYGLGIDAPEVYVNLDKERVYFATCCNSLGWFTDTHLRSKAHETTQCMHFWNLLRKKNMVKVLIR